MTKPTIIDFDHCDFHSTELLVMALDDLLDRPASKENTGYIDRVNRELKLREFERNEVQRDIRRSLGCIGEEISSCKFLLNKIWEKQRGE